MPELDDPRPFDCQNNPCWFAVDSSAARTQGRCRCLQDLPLTSAQRRWLERSIRLTIKAHVDRAVTTMAVKCGV